MPVLVPADLSSWMEERQRQSDLQVVLGSADSARVVEVTTKLAEGARRLAEIDEHRERPVSRVQDARYGLRGIRVGEASNSGSRSRSRSPVRATMEFDLTRLDSDDDPLVPPPSSTQGAVQPLPTWVDSPSEQTTHGDVNARHVARRVDSRAVVEIKNRFSPLEDAVNVTVGTADAISGSDTESEVPVRRRRVCASFRPPKSPHSASGGTFVPSVGEEDWRCSTGGAHATRVATTTVVSADCSLDVGSSW